MIKIDTLNQMIKIISNEQDIKFINNDENFRYRNDSIDDNMMLPGNNLHLCNAGIKSLLGNQRLYDMTNGELENNIMDTPSSVNLNAKCLEYGNITPYT